MNRARIVVVAAAVALLVVVAAVSAFLDGDDATLAGPTATGEESSGGPAEGFPAADALTDVERRAEGSSGGVDVEDARTEGSADAGGGSRAAPGARGSLLVDDSSRSDPAQAAGTASTLDKEAVKRGISAAKPKIIACYESALKVQPELMGRIVVEFKIEASPDGGGAVTSGEVTDSDVASPFFEACVLKEVAGTPFDAPSGSGTVTVRYPFQFENAAEPDAGPR